MRRNRPVFLVGLAALSFVLVVAAAPQGSPTQASAARPRDMPVETAELLPYKGQTPDRAGPPAEDAGWLPLSNMDIALAELGCVWFDEGGPQSVYNQKVYCMGGRTLAGPIGSIYRYDPRADSWEATGDNLPQAVSSYAAVLIQDENYGALGPAIYVIGGRQTLSNSEAVQRYYPRTRDSELLESDPWPGQVSGHSTIPGGCAAVENKVYCFGGFAPTAWPYFSAATYEYDPARAAGQRWQTLSATLAPARSHIMVAVQGTVIYASGGLKGYNPVTQAMDPANNVEALDVSDLGLGWQPKSAMPLDMGAGQAFAPASPAFGNEHSWQDTVLTAGGISDWPNASAEAMAYSTISNTWSQGFPDLNNARSHPAGVFIPLCTPDVPSDTLPALLMAGGWCGLTPCFTAEYFPAPCYRPEASFAAAPVAGCLPLTVRFTDTSSADPPILEWQWQFGDGTSTNEQHPTHTYYLDGDMQVTLTVTNFNGSDVATGTIVAHPLPLASFAYSPTSGPPPLTVYLTNTSSAATNPFWAYGDGTYGAGDTVSHTYDLTGTYSVGLTVTSPYGCRPDHTVRTVLVGVDCEPVSGAGFEWCPLTPTENQVVTFHGVASGTGTIVFTWAWGDGEQGSGQNPSHTFTDGGDYTVTMTATNPCSRQVVQHAIHVCAPPHNLGALWEPDPPVPEEVVTFTAAADGDPPIQFAWDLGDGSSGSGALITHTYDMAGNYALVLTTTNSCGEQAIQRVVHVCTAVRGADFTWSPLEPAAGDKVTFNGTAQGEDPITFAWSFGDGASGGGHTITHTFAASGTYGVVMTATNACGQDVVSDTVDVGPWPTQYVYLPILFQDTFFGPCESEPNNSPSEANGPLRSGRDYCGLPNDADDYFYFSTLAGGVTVDLTNYQGQGGQLILYDIGFNPIVWDNDPADGYHIEATVTAGLYYIRLYSVGFSGEPYTLRATLIEP